MDTQTSTQAPCDADRVACLRGRCLVRKHASADCVLSSARSLRGSEHVASWQVRAGLRTRDRLAGLEIEIDDLELLGGRIARGREDRDDPQRREAEEYLKQFPWPGGQTGHCELDRGRLFEIGLDALRAEVAGLRDSSDGERRDAYESFCHALAGLSALIDHARQAARDALADAPDWRQAELRRIADACEHVAHHPPRTFFEAIQLLWLTDLAVMWGDQIAYAVPGHLDRTLRPYYQADLAAGRIDSREALLLIESLYLLVNEYVHDGGAVSVMVGGRDADGHDVTNELSYLCLEALRRTRLIYPTVGVCWHEGTPRDLLDLAVDLIAEGISTPAVFNDPTIQNGLAGLDLPAGRRCNYINSTCVEITPVGGSNVWVASPYFPVCRYLLEEIAEQSTSPEAAGVFEGFFAAYAERLRRRVAEGAAEQNRIRRDRSRLGRKPLQSVFTRGCLQRGRDLDDGGAETNWIECSFVGLANLADSLCVIRREVFEQRAISLAELKAVLDADFAGQEAVRQRFLTASPKYGNADPAADAMLGRLVDLCIDACRPHRMEPDGSPFVPGCFCWIMHEVLGRESGATPDGRRAGWPFADGAGPAQGREHAGPTAAILSTTSWDHRPMVGGLAYNMKFSRSLLAGASARRKLAELILTYLRRGGFEVQVNVVDADRLRAAQADPEQYRDLVVRIGGYTDYFTRLSPQMQAEIIQRTEFDSL